MARPTLLSPEFIAEFAAKLRLSGNIDTACGLVGIHRDTFFKWQRAVNQGHGTKLQKRLMAEVTASLAEVKLRNELIIQQAGGKFWQAAAWWLERRFAKEYGKPDPYRPIPADTTEETDEFTKRLRDSRDPEVIRKAQDLYRSLQSNPVNSGE